MARIEEGARLTIGGGVNFWSPGQLVSWERQPSKEQLTRGHGVIKSRTTPRLHIQHKAPAGVQRKIQVQTHKRTSIIHTRVWQELLCLRYDSKPTMRA